MMYWNSHLSELHYKREAWISVQDFYIYIHSMGEFSNSNSFQGKNNFKSVFLGKYFLTGDTVDTVFVYL